MSLNSSILDGLMEEGETDAGRERRAGMSPLECCKYSKTEDGKWEAGGQTQLGDVFCLAFAVFINTVPKILKN